MNLQKPMTKKAQRLPISQRQSKCKKSHVLDKEEQE
jgi:hypothetical protein